MWVLPDGRPVMVEAGAPAPGRTGGARFRQMLEDLLVVVFEADAELRVRYVSGRATTAFGYEVGEWVGSSGIWDRLIHEADRPAFEAAAREVLDSVSETELEFRVRTANGAVLWVRTLLGAVAVTKRRVHLRGVMLDVTDRRYAEGSARQYAERMRRLLDHSADPLLVHDVRGRIVEGNRAASDALGYTRRELLEMTVRDVEVGYEEGRSRESWSALGPGRRQVEEVRCLRRDGTVLPAESHRNLFEWEGQPLFVVLYRDITERRHLEAQLRQSQKLEEVGRLTGGLAHDFHNMLTAIKGHAELLLSGTGVEHRADLEQIASAADRATVLTRKLLAFSRRGATAPETVDLNALVEETMRLLGPLIGERIEVRTDLGARGVVRGDRSQFEQVLVNLVVNARDAMAEGGTLVVTTVNVEVSELRPFRHSFVQPGRYVKVRVTDTGHGMDEATRLRVFDPFFTTKDPGKGSGLGLSTVYGIVKESGGYIIAESEPGRGTTFLVLLPESLAVEPLVAMARPPRPESKVAAAACTAMVVEDEPAVRLLIRRIMERDGHRVLEATNGEQALEVSRGFDERIDLLITDVMMPGMGGPALARVLLGERPGLRVILTSGYGDDIVAAPRGARAALFLEKPFSPDQLGEAVRDALAAQPPDLVPDVPEK